MSQTMRQWAEDVQADQAPHEGWPAKTLLVCTTLTCALVLLTGCGNRITTEINGAVAATMDKSGSVKFLMKVCSGAVNEVILFGPHKGPETKPQEPIGVWHASTPVRHDTVLTLAEPGPVWEVRRDPGVLNARTPYSVFASYRSADQELSQVDFTTEQLRTLSPGTVRFKGSAGNRAEFVREACRRSS